MKYTLIPLIFSVEIIFAPEKSIITFMCAVGFALFMIADELSKMTEQRKKDSEELLRTIEATMQDLINKK